ncbi:MAG: PQQ-binding-like beta-propeller repeat protein, partial [Candidatus Paceibacterota bacterium]
LVIFGSYDGNVYALNKNTGKKEWISFEADWVGSSPAVAADLGLVFIGLEFGLFKRRGGIVALNARTGETVWTDYTHFAFTHASPKYIGRHEQVVIGSNDGIVRLYDAKTGKLIWKFTTFGGAEYDTSVDAGFGTGEIKESMVYDEERDYIIFGATDGFLYILNRENGNLVHHFKCQFGIWATPFLYKDKVYFTSLDKRIRCLNLDTFEIVFDKNVDGTRIFSSPTVIDGKLYVGTNAGRLHEFDSESGEELGYFQALERITNAVVKNNKTGLFFLPTYANEIICLERVKENKDITN